MEEISAKPFAAPSGSNIAGWSSGNKNRATYDEIADYDRFADDSTAIKTLAGDTQVVGSMGPYYRSVKVVEGPVPVGHTGAGNGFQDGDDHCDAPQRERDRRHEGVHAGDAVELVKPMKALRCHPERSEGSLAFERGRSFAALRMTKVQVAARSRSRADSRHAVCSCWSAPRRRRSRRR
jgi:hypothetical protein